jgi:ribosomal protein S18 acetylase RimI-like enzyme
VIDSTASPLLSPFQVRLATDNDIPRLIDMIQAMAVESEGIELKLETLSQGVQAVFEDAHKGQYWILETLVPAQNEAIGCTLITQEWSDWNNIPYWWVQSVYIQPEYRGKNTLEHLFDAIEAQAKAVQVPEIRLYVEVDNKRAIRAYEKRGFHDGHYALMQKKI